MCYPIHFCLLTTLQDERDKKRQEQLERKSELKKLANDEMASLKSKTTGGAASKVTRAQISETKAKEKQPSGATPLPKKVTEDPPLLENPNLLMRERESQGIVDASTVDEAISVLSVKDPAVDKHPERRMKAAFAAFEERELPRLKEENPQLRLSQLKQLLKKEWMKSPENPMNQLHQPYNKS